MCQHTLNPFKQTGIFNSDVSFVAVVHTLEAVVRTLEALLEAKELLVEKQFRALLSEVVTVS